MGTVKSICGIDPLFSVIPLKTNLANFLYLLSSCIHIYGRKFLLANWHSLSENLSGNWALDTFYIYIYILWLFFNAGFLHLVGKQYC